VSLFGARSAAAAGAAALLSIAGESLACPCGNSATVNGPLTSQMETSGFMAAQSLTLVHGAFNARGEYRSLDDNHQGALLWTGSAAYRLERRVELGATLSYGRSWLRHGALSASDEGFGDLQLRAFWDAIDEPMPYYKSFWPALGIFATVRIPTRGLTGPVGGGGSLGSPVAAQSLGAWEGSVGARLLRRLGRRFWGSLTAEGAARLEDDTFGFDRHLGPRLLGQLMLQYRATGDLSLAATSTLAWEAPVSVEGRTLDGTAQRLWTVGGVLSWAPAPAPLRASAVVEWSPPLSEISANAVAATRVGLSLLYTR